MQEHPINNMIVKQLESDTSYHNYAALLTILGGLLADFDIKRGKVTTGRIIMMEGNLFTFMK